VKNLSPEVRSANPDISWRRMAGMRDKLIHDYFGVEVDLVWEVSTSLLPPLKAQLESIVRGLPDAPA
jgi:uncharacterized protein with HEPN domain